MLLLIIQQDGEHVQCICIIHIHTFIKVYVRHPELAAAKANRDYVFKQVCEAVTTISDVAQGKGPQIPQNPYDGPGELAAALDDFDVSLWILVLFMPIFCV